MFNPINLSIPALILSIGLSFAPAPHDNTVRGSGHWEYDSYYSQSFYVYETVENAVFEGASDGVAYFVTTDGDIDGEVWGSYIWDSDLQEGESVTLTFENRVTQEEYARGVETGETREDSGRIVAID